MKIYIICCFPAQILHLRKFLFLRYSPQFLSHSDCRMIFKSTISPEKIGKTAPFFACWSKYGFSQSDFWTLKLSVSQEWTDGINWYIACKYNFMEIKKLLNILGVGMVRTGCGQSGDKNLKPTVSDGWTGGINWFLACEYRFTKIKSRSKKF